ncbi:predicted protein [Histoplasma mississippiense (nom. inval.)]|uniref:predicted protein n=1 Tax=Ajellomyces capsulatus (strain NAm1 / WU24) TaxID=2059318 RepID=UPI000157B924|nr:predicted protein [Histoplasma mississippiense (nom. inval.)]EDN03559.1 predicted protein [Histoplasma mississippiense (nom. inval.)]
MATGIHPIDPARVLKKIQPRPLTPPELLQQRTPTSIRALRGLIKQASQRHRRLSVDIKKILRAGENIALDREVLLIENKNLQTALNNERRRRKRGKRMGLLNPSNPSLAQFFSPTKVQAAREQADANETAKIDDQARKEDMKLQRAILREQKQAELMERKEQREKERLEAAQRLGKEGTRGGLKEAYKKINSGLKTP